MTTMIKKIVIMADDDKEDCLLAKEAFSKSGAIVSFFYVGNGVELIDYLSKHSKSEPDGLPDLILLDLNMPFVNGLEALRKIRANKKFDNIPIVILTTSTDKTDRDFSMMLGANDFISKPDSFNEWVEIMKSLKRAWLDT
jgi:CheY-like chemotaxis protein